MDVDSGCGCKKVYRFPHNYNLFLHLLYLLFFAAASLLFSSFLNVFRFCSGAFFVMYVKKISRSINTHTGDYGRPTVAI